MDVQMHLNPTVESKKSALQWEANLDSKWSRYFVWMAVEQQIVQLQVYWVHSNTGVTAASSRSAQRVRAGVEGNIKAAECDEGGASFTSSLTQGWHRDLEVGNVWNELGALRVGVGVPSLTLSISVTYYRHCFHVSEAIIWIRCCLTLLVYVILNLEWVFSYLEVCEQKIKHNIRVLFRILI